MPGQQSFAAQIDAWVRTTKGRQLAVLQTAAQRVIEDVVDRCPVDTGYLRSSLTVTTDAPLPMRDDARPAKGMTYQAKPFVLTIAQANLSTKIYATFIASYAAAVEYGARGRPGVGMVRLAAQRWPDIVAQAVAETKSAAGFL